MKRHVQQPGIRQWAGDDFLDLQTEPLRILDEFFEEYGPCIIKGVHITHSTGDLYNVSAGLVALSGTDVEGKETFKVVPFAGIDNMPLPLYLTLTHSVVTRPYVDGEVKPVAYDYRAAVTTVKPDSAAYLELGMDTAPRFVDVIQDGNHRFTTDTERKKLKGVEEGANKYVHPENHPASMITEDAIHRFMTDVERKKLKGIEEGANKYAHPDNHSADMVEFTDGENLQQKYDSGKMNGELPVQTILRTTSQAGNIFGEKWIPCDGRKLEPEEYPWIDIPFVSFETMNPALGMGNYSCYTAKNGAAIVIVAITSGGGAAYIHYSTDDGKTFNKLNREFQSSDATVLYLHDRFFALFNEHIMFSLNGKDWEEGNFYGDEALPYDVFYTYVNGYYLICDYQYGTNIYSTDGVNWYDCSGNLDTDFLITGNGVALSGNSTNSGPYYNNGATEWKITNLGDYTNDYYIAYVKKRFWFVIKDNCSEGWVSTDGINWEKLAPNGLESFSGIYTLIDNGKIILALNEPTQKKYKSIDGGITFVEYTAEVFPNHVINGIFVYAEMADWWQSTDGESWKHSTVSYNVALFGKNNLIVFADKLVYRKLGLFLPNIEDHYVKLIE